mmetsp:Transcript_41571/g.128425  ORF Transcript_41571/g.128425 Transcript_41571/m.128425 type:complete len:215 (+) Transcript_41571:329-973(+)
MPFIAPICLMMRAHSSSQASSSRLPTMHRPPSGREMPTLTRCRFEMKPSPTYMSRCTAARSRLRTVLMITMGASRPWNFSTEHTSIGHLPLYALPMSQMPPGAAVWNRLFSTSRSTAHCFAYPLRTTMSAGFAFDCDMTLAMRSATAIASASLRHDGESGSCDSVPSTCIAIAAECSNGNVPWKRVVFGCPVADAMSCPPYVGLYRETMSGCAR